ncbi:hypothetical protein ACFL4G_11180 [Thermodesulfobacteriota bacterium]
MLTGELKAISSLTETDKARMHGIMLKHYAEVRESSFLRDLEEKEGALILYDEEGRIQGFSTYMSIATVYRGDEIAALFSGDTVIDKDHWGTQALFNTFGRLLYRIMDENMGKKIYWFLITMGFRTYMMMPLFFRTFYPRHDQETPAYEKGLIEHLARLKYDDRFDKERAIITTDSYHLKEEFAEIPAARHRNRNVQFFLEKNPGYRAGEELACVCEICPESFRRRTRSLVRP